MPSRKHRRDRDVQARIEPVAVHRESFALDRSVLRKVGMGLVAAKVVLVPIAFDPTAYVVFAQPKALLGHALGFVLLGVLSALGVRHGRSVLQPMPMHVAVAGVVAVSSLATLFALDRQVALYGTLDRQLGLVTLLDNVILYFAIVILVRSRMDLFILAGAAAIATLGMLVYALIQRTGLDPLVWRSGIATERPFAMLGNPGNLAQFFGTVAAATAAGLMSLWARANWGWRFVLGSWTLLALAGALLSAARAVGLGLSATAVLLGALAIARWVPKRWRGLAALATAAVLALGLGVGAREIIGTGIDLVTGRVPVTEGSIAGRVDLYRIALDQVADRPILGVGPDNYVVDYARLRAPDMTQFHESDAPQTSPHSWPLKVATDSGTLGLVAHTVLLGLAAWRAVRLGGIALVGLAAIASFLATGTLSIGDVGTEWLLWAGLGLIALPPAVAQDLAAPVQGGRRRSWTHPRLSAGRAGLAWLSIALGVGASLFQYNALEASRAAASSRQARQIAPPFLSAATASAERAVALDSGRPEYWHELGLSLAAGGEIRAAEDAFRRAADAAPYQAVYLINLAKAQIAIGQGSQGPKLTEALATARRAVAADPFLGDVHAALALALLANGQPTPAAEAAERALALDRTPTDRTIFEIAARAYLETGKLADVERWVLLGIPRTAGRDQIDLRLVWARALMQQDRIADAREQLRIVLEFAPDDPGALLLQRQISVQ